MSDTYVSKLVVTAVDFEKSPRLGQLHEFYCKEFLSNPEFFVRVPGRVNLIGEHVDYCGYPVLPMALDQSILLAVGHTNENSILHLSNVAEDKFKSFKCDMGNISIDQVPNGIGPEWYKYFLCGVKGILESLKCNSQHFGMSVAVSGNIPPASGLSSSSALVSAAALATAHVFGLPLERKELASISANCERYIGTQGGGMDQAIAFLAKKGCAQYIEFHPNLRATSIQLPTGSCFVVANSLAEKNKAASSDFNERVVECRLGARYIAKCKGFAKWRNILRFAQLQSEIGCSLEELEQLVLKYLPNDIYTREELCKEFEVQEGEFEINFLTPNTVHMQRFKLRQRALHVVQESIRVCRFRETCENGSTRSITNGKDKTSHEALPPTTLSELMRQSHHSLKELYECSHPDLDRIIAISDDALVGARLTGAGWGGCIVALCNSIKEAEKYIQELKEKYYAKLPAHILEQHQQNDFSDLIFATFPQNGAEIMSLEPFDS